MIRKPFFSVSEILLRKKSDKKKKIEKDRDLEDRSWKREKKIKGVNCLNILRTNSYIYAPTMLSYVFFLFVCIYLSETEHVGLF